MRSHRIAVIPGDGIGPEVITGALRVLDAAASRFGFVLEKEFLPFSGEHYLKTGELMTPAAIDGLRNFDALFLGAVGHPGITPGIVERSILGGLRRGFDLFANIRPVRSLHPALSPLKKAAAGNLDFVIVRENTEDLYTQRGRYENRGTRDEVAHIEGFYTYAGVERITRYAFELARRRSRAKTVMLVDKSNAIPFQDIWGRVFEEVGQEFDDIRREHLYVDVAALKLVETPERFDVILTSNLFGDILSDLSAGLIGGLGFAPSANLHPGRPGLFEPVHGSAPDIAGSGRANPIAAILSGAMMLEALGETEATRVVEEAVSQSLRSLTTESSGELRIPDTGDCANRIRSLVEAR